MASTFVVQCPKCAHCASFDSRAIGKEIACQRCGFRYRITASAPPQQPFIRVQCACGRRFKAAAEHAGRKTVCPACRQPLVIPYVSDADPAGQTQLAQMITGEHDGDPGASTFGAPTNRAPGRRWIGYGVFAAAAVVVAVAGFWYGRASRVQPTITAQNVSSPNDEAMPVPRHTPIDTPRTIAPGTIAPRSRVEADAAAANEPSLPSNAIHRAQPSAQTDPHNTETAQDAPTSAPSSDAPADGDINRAVSENPADMAAAPPRDLQAIGHALTAEINDAINAKAYEQAATLIADAQRDLQAFAASVNLPLWDDSVARLLRLAEEKCAVIREQRPDLASSDAMRSSDYAFDSAAKLPPEIMKDLLQVRRRINDTAPMLQHKDLRGAEALVRQQRDALDALCRMHKLPPWHRVTAALYKRMAEIENDIDAQHQERMEAERLAALQRGSGQKSSTPSRGNDARIGKPAPGFRATTLDGRALTSGMFAGRWVLLDFWASWCGPCRAEMPHLQEVFAKHGDDRRFVMISLSLDSNLFDAQQYVAKERLGWVHGWIGRGSTVADVYGVHSIPSIFLIDPDGNVFATNLRGSRMKEMVDGVLAAKSSSGRH